MTRCRLGAFDAAGERALLLDVDADIVAAIAFPAPPKLRSPPEIMLLSPFVRADAP